MLGTNINRLIDLNTKKLTHKYAKKGIFFAPAAAVINSKPINFYNHGCPHVLLSCSANKPLAEKIAASLHAHKSTMVLFAPATQIIVGREAKLQFVGNL